MAGNIGPWYKDNNAVKLVVIGALVLLFAVAEFAVGTITGSLALVADAFHMLADLISLMVAFWAIRVGKKSRTPTFSYGWIRAEIVGGLSNGVFLLTVVLFIVLEAIQRVVNPPGHGHGHSHSHASRDSTVGLVENQVDHGKVEVVESNSSHDSHDESERNSHDSNSSHNNESHSAHGSHGSHASHDSHAHSNAGEGKLNMHGVFLHVLGDALGSLAAIVSGLCIWLMPWPQKFYIDPILSIVVALIITRASIPLVRRCIKILMQSVPETVDLAEIETELGQIEGVRNIHELHVWQLSDTKSIGTVHLTCNVESIQSFHTIAGRIKKILHAHGIHSTTIQPEFAPTTPAPDSKPECMILCEEDNCKASQCCGEDETLLSAMESKVTRRKKEIVSLP